jgi:hypothetical protein
MINSDKTLETKRILLKALNVADIEQFKPLTADKEMWIFLQTICLTLLLLKNGLIPVCLK